MFGVAGGDGLPMMYGGDGWMWGGWGWGGWILMTLAMVVFWALVITAIVLAIRYLTGGPLRSADSQRRNAALTRAYDFLIRRPMPGRAVPDAVSQEPWTAAPC
jgi:uncharacterized membrane protein